MPQCNQKNKKAASGMGNIRKVLGSRMAKNTPIMKLVTQKVMIPEPASKFNAVYQEKRKRKLRKN